MRVGTGVGPDGTAIGERDVELALGDLQRRREHAVEAFDERRVVVAEVPLPVEQQDLHRPDFLRVRREGVGTPVSRLPGARPRLRDGLAPHPTSGRRS
jgi:hypothetical protein